MMRKELQKMLNFDCVVHQIPSSIQVRFYLLTYHRYQHSTSLQECTVLIEFIHFFKLANSSRTSTLSRWRDGTGAIVSYRIWTIVSLRKDCDCNSGIACTRQNVSPPCSYQSPLFQNMQMARHKVFDLSRIYRNRMKANTNKTYILPDIHRLRLHDIFDGQASMCIEYLLCQF